MRMSKEDIMEKINLDDILNKDGHRSEEHTSELQSPVPISYAVFCLKKKKKKKTKSHQKSPTYRNKNR